MKKTIKIIILSSFLFLFAACDKGDTSSGSGSSEKASTFEVGTYSGTSKANVDISGRNTLSFGPEAFTAEVTETQFSVTHDNQTVSAQIDSNGRISFKSPRISETIEGRKCDFEVSVNGTIIGNKASGTLEGSANCDDGTKAKLVNSTFEATKQ